MKISRTLVVLAAMSVLMGSAAYADTLHGYCVSPAPACIDNGTITPTGVNPPHFSFSYSGNASKNGSGDLWLIGLVPDNKNGGFALTLNGSDTSNSSVAGSLFSSTEWHSGKLSGYLTTPSFPKPAHPLNAYLPSTQLVDPGPNGYFVYTFAFGTFNYNTTADPDFSVGSGSVPQGMLFLEVLTNSANVVQVDTPNSATLIETSAPTTVVPEPGSLLLVGSGLIGMAGVVRRKLML